MDPFEFRMRSDSLRRWRHIQPGSILGQEVLAVDVFILVFDSSALQRDLRWLARVAGEKPGTPLPRTALMEAMDAGVVIGLVPPRALDEIAKHLPTIARTTGTDLPLVRRIWDGYRLRLLVFHPRGEGTNPELAERDPSDLDFVAVMQESAADALLTADRDLLDHVERARTPCDTANILRTYAREKAVAIGGQASMIAASTAVAVGPRMVSAAVRTGAEYFSRLPWWAKVITFGVGMWAIQKPDLQAWFKRQPQNLAEFGRKAFFRVATDIGAAIKAEDAARDARALLDGHFKARNGRLTLRAAMLRILAPQDFGLTHDELAREALRLGYRTKARDFPSTVLRHLRMDRTFVLKNGRWHLAVGEVTSSRHNPSSH